VQLGPTQRGHKLGKGGFKINRGHVAKIVHFLVLALAVLNDVVPRHFHFQYRDTHVELGTIRRVDSYFARGNVSVTMSV